MERTKTSYFSSKLKKKYIHSIKKYEKLDVFDRLNNYETFALRRLFRSIKTFMVRFRGYYPSKP